MNKLSVTSIIKNAIVILFLSFSGSLSQAVTIQISAENFEQKLNEAIESSPAGTEIVMPKGRFDMTNELVITKAGLKIKGQGMHKTTLSFKKQKVGSQGIFGSADSLTFEDFGIEDSTGNGLKVVSAHSPTFRRIRIAWTAGSRKENGAYALYPVMSHNVLIEECEISGASDAGIYVGQSKNIIVRNNRAFENVAGIEIENSTHADVYNNEVFNNSAGILIFNLPNLPVMGGRQTRVFANKAHDNNHPNFSSPGTIIHLVPSGLGIFVMANSEVEIFKNEIYDNNLTGVAIANYHISERKITDASYDPMPRHISIYENNFSEGRFKLFSSNKMSAIIKLLTGFKTPEIIYDGIDDGTYVGEKPTEVDRLCIRKNTTREGAAVRFGNLHLDHKQSWRPWPGGPATTDLAPHDCSHATFPEIALEASPRLPAEEPAPLPETVEQKCRLTKPGVNWGATEYDCSKLSDYGLFKAAAVSTQDPNERGFLYRLNNELFTDYAEKSRFIFLPPNTQMAYRADGVMDFPVGTIISKTFSLFMADGDRQKPQQIETRLLIKIKSGWVASEYLWDLEKKEAFLFLGGAVREMRILPHGKGEPLNISYGVPNRRQCASCHVTDAEFGLGKLTPIGPKAKFLNWMPDEKHNQLAEFAQKGFLKDLPKNPFDVPTLPIWNRPETGSLDSRAKAYLEMNCAHCHNPVGPAKNTGLYLLTTVPSDTVMYGKCKPPVAAGPGTGGRSVDVMPGKADESILIYRISHSNLAVRMPQLGRSVAHTEAVDMLEEWINKMAPEKCIK